MTSRYMAGIDVTGGDDDHRREVSAFALFELSTRAAAGAQLATVSVPYGYMVGMSPDSETGKPTKWCVTDGIGYMAVPLEITTTPLNSLPVNANVMRWEFTSGAGYWDKFGTVDEIGCDLALYWKADGTKYSYTIASGTPEDKTDDGLPIARFDHSTHYFHGGSGDQDAKSESVFWDPTVAATSTQAFQKFDSTIGEHVVYTHGAGTVTVDVTGADGIEAASRYTQISTGGLLVTVTTGGATLYGGLDVPKAGVAYDLAAGPLNSQQRGFQLADRAVNVPYNGGNVGPIVATIVATSPFLFAVNEAPIRPFAVNCAAGTCTAQSTELTETVTVGPTGLPATRTEDGTVVLDQDWDTELLRVTSVRTGQSATDPTRWESNTSFAYDPQTGLVYDTPAVAIDGTTDDDLLAYSGSCAGSSAGLAYVWYGAFTDSPPVTLNVLENGQYLVEDVICSSVNQTTGLSVPQDDYQVLNRLVGYAGQVSSNHTSYVSSAGSTTITDTFGATATVNLNSQEVLLGASSSDALAASALNQLAYEGNVVSGGTVTDTWLGNSIQSQSQSSWSSFTAQSSFNVANTSSPLYSLGSGNVNGSENTVTGAISVNSGSGDEVGGQCTYGATAPNRLTVNESTNSCVMAASTVSLPANSSENSSTGSVTSTLVAGAKIDSQLQTGSQTYSQ
jgi:hypothetical protein